jgi:hypothetical protein
MAYCLLGIFDVNLPLLYGEGSKAFHRLQEEILKISNDHSLFASGVSPKMHTMESVLDALNKRQEPALEKTKGSIRLPSRWMLRILSGNDRFSEDVWLHLRRNLSTVATFFLCDICRGPVAHHPLLFNEVFVSISPILVIFRV